VSLADSDRTRIDRHMRGMSEAADVTPTAPPSSAA
jgi:hypothetical protein